MTYGIAIMFFLLPMYMYDFMSVYIAYLLDGRKMPYRMIYALLVPLSMGQTLAYSALMFIGSSSNIIIHTLLRVFFRIFEIAIGTSWIWFLFRDISKKKRFFYVSVGFPFYILSTYGSNALTLIISPELRGVDFNDFVLTPSIAFLMLFLSFIVPISTMVITWLAAKTNFWRQLQAFGDYPKLYIPMGILCFLFYIGFGVYMEKILSAELIFHVIYLFYLALLVLIVLIVSDLKRTENLKASHNLLIQQQNYIGKLEIIQQEIRSIQHDYTNMLAGLYAHAGEGNVEAVKEYIDTKLLKIDETVRDDLLRMNQLTMIKLPELKGLIMTKMLEAERNQISFRLEAMFPVISASMATEDLLRCIGILLDNAIEEAQKQKNADLTLLLLQEGKALTIIVENPTLDKPNLAQVQNEGYSTKGTGRGVGLFNYKNILRKYPNAAQETKIVENRFIQTLVLTDTR